MDQTDRYQVAPSRRTVAGLPEGLLGAAWREYAERGAPACLVCPSGGVLDVVWVNLALSEMLEVDSGQLVGHSLRELSDSVTFDRGSQGTAHGSRGVDEPGPPPATDGPAATTDGPAATTDGPAVTADGPAVVVPAPSRPQDDARPEAVDRSLLPWAVTVHRLARGAGGSQVARAVRQDGTVLRVRVRVSPVGISHSDGEFAAGSPVVGGPGVVGSLAAPPEPRAWLVVLDEVDNALWEAESALAVAENRFAALAGSAPIGIFASDAGLRLGYVNERFVALTGLPIHALLGTGWLDAIYQEDLPGVYAAVQTVLGGTPVEVAVRLSRQDKECWLLLRLAPTTAHDRTAVFIGTAEDVTQRRSWEEHLTYQAQHDPLTGLVNRRRLIEVLTDLLGSRRSRDREFAILFLDLDGFKIINDSLGHDAGDRALVEVARRMQRVVRETDVLARVSGDEFVVVLRFITNETEAAAAARRHLAALAPSLKIGRNELRLSASIGVALPTPFDTPESLLRRADHVMYEAKASGHGQYRMAPMSGEAR